MKYLFSLLLLLGLISSCGNQDGEKTIENGQKEAPKENLEVEQYINDLELAKDSLDAVNSLSYSNAEFEMVEVTAHLNAKQEVVRVLEKHMNSETGQGGSLIFYLKDGKKIASRESKEIRKEGTAPYYLDIVTYYDKNEKALSSKSRTAEFEEQLDYEAYSKAELTTHSMDNALDVLNQKGPYETTFQGFVESGPFSFLIVGGTGENAYTSPLTIQQNNKTLVELKIKGKELLGKPLNVYFEKMIDASGYEVQVLLDVSFKN